MNDGQIIDVPHSINQSDPNFTAASATTAGTGDGSTEAELGTFECPTGLKFVVLPLAALSAYLSDNESTPAECGDGTPFRVVEKDASGTIAIDRMSGTYEQIKTFDDQNKLRRFNEKFTIREKQKLIIYVAPLTGKSLKPADSRFNIDTRRISQMLSL